MSNQSAGACNISRRSFVLGAAAAAVTMSVSGNAVEFAFAEGEVDTSKPIEKRHTFCDMCNQVPFCGLTAYVQDEHVVRIESRQPFATGPLCAKGLASIQELYDPERLLYPMRRTNEKGVAADWERISWDDAYQEIAAQLNRVKAEAGAEKVMFYCGDPKEPRGPICRVASLFGTPTLGFESSLCATATQMCMRLVYGNNRQDFGVDPSDATNCCIIWSLNAAWSQPNRHLNFMKHKERGCKFIIVDPRITPTVTSLADIHLQPRPGTDGALALGFINLLIQEDLYDHDFVENWTHGFDELKELAAEYTPEKVEEITWVPAETLRAAVEMATQNTPTTLQSSSAGITHTTNAGHAQRAVFMIPALLGQVDVKGGMWFGMPALPIAGGATGRGTTTQFRMDKVMTSEEFKSRRPDKEDFPAWWTMNPHFQTAKLPEYVADGKIKAAVLVGTNAMIWPHTSEYQEAIKNLDFSVAVDYYYRPWTHDYVDMILPAATCYERMAPFATFGRTVYFRDPVIQPLGEAREDWQIMLELGCALGFEEECFGGSVEGAIQSVLESGNVGITIDDLRAGKEEGITIPGDKNVEKKYEVGKFSGTGEPGFATPSGKVEFVSEVLKKCGLEGRPVYEEPVHSPVTAEGEDKNYTLVLNSGGRLPYYTHSKLRDIPWLNQFMPEPVVRLHPKDAKERNIKTGDDVRLFNHLGEINVKAEVSNIVLPGVVDIFHGWHQANINELIPRDFDPVTGYPPFRAALCEVELV